MKTNLNEKITENQLIEGCKSGKEVYQEQLYKQFYAYAISISRLYTYSDDEAVSILNDSFIKVFSIVTKKEFELKSPFKFYLRKIVINTAIDNYRKNKKHNVILDIDEIEPTSYTVDVIDNLAYDDIIQLLDKLPEMHRVVFNLYEIQGYKHNEIAEKLQISESSSRTFLTRAKKKMRILINKHF